MYYAADDTIGAGAPPPGGIEISAQAYRFALAAKLEGRDALVVDGALVIRDKPPSSGHTWENGEWVAPPEPEPEPVEPPRLSPRQLRLMLLTLDMDESDVEAAIDAIEDEHERAAAMIEWRHAARYERDHPLAIELADALQFEPHELDALWAAAAEL